MNWNWWPGKQNSRESIVVGEGTQIAADAWLDGDNGTIEIGKNCLIHPMAMLLPYDGFIKLGHECSVNPFAVLYGHGGLTIGNYVRIATHVVIIPANHGYADPNIPITFQNVTQEGVVIEDDVWVGCNATILDGVTIGKGSVIAAGAVVTKDIDPYSVVAGSPARLIKKRS